MYRKLCFLLITILMAAIPWTGVFAASNPVIYSDEITAGKDAEIKIPVYIKENPGIMGFRITAEYDDKKMTVMDISSGELTENGILSNSLKPGSEESSFDVLWSSSENAKGDGTLFYIYAGTTSKFKGEAEIKLSYAKEDTFNEDFKPVKLKCKTIKIGYDKAGSGQKLDENPAENHLAGEIKDEIVSRLNDEKTVDVVKKALKDNGIEDPADMTPEQAKKTMDDILKAMDEDGIDTTNIRDMLEEADKDESIETGDFYRNLVEVLYKDSSANLETGEHIDVPEQSSKGGSHLKWIIAALVIAAILAAGAFIFWKRK